MKAAPAISAAPKMGTCVPKMSGMGGCFCGRRGLPPEAIAIMYADYLRLGSLAKVGKLHGRTRQGMFSIFENRGLKLNEKKFLPAVIHDGVKYTAQKTQGKHRYLRATVRHEKKTRYLHHEVWVKHNGPIPRGYKVCFKDGNHLNVAPTNLELLTNSEQVKKYATTGRNQFTMSAKSRLSLLVNNFASGSRSLSTSLKRRAA